MKGFPGVHVQRGAFCLLVEVTLRSSEGGGLFVEAD